MVGPTRKCDAFGNKRAKPLTDDELEELTGSREDRLIGSATNGNASPSDRRKAIEERKKAIARKNAQVPA